jgi:hypothetical protein
VLQGRPVLFSDSGISRPEPVSRQDAKTQRKIKVKIRGLGGLCARPPQFPCNTTAASCICCQEGDSNDPIKALGGVDRPVIGRSSDDSRSRHSRALVRSDVPVGQVNLTVSNSNGTSRTYPLTVNPTPARLTRAGQLPGRRQAVSGRAVRRWEFRTPTGRHRRSCFEAREAWRHAGVLRRRLRPGGRRDPRGNFGDSSHLADQFVPVRVRQHAGSGRLFRTGALVYRPVPIQHRGAERRTQHGDPGFFHPQRNQGPLRRFTTQCKTKAQSTRAS